MSETNETLNKDGDAGNTTAPNKSKLDESLFLLSKKSIVGDTIISKEDAAKMEKIVRETQLSNSTYDIKLTLDKLVDITNTILLTYKNTVVEEKYKQLMREGLDMLYTSTLSRIKKEIDQLLMMCIPPHKGFVEHPENIKEVHASIKTKPISVPIPVNPIPQPKMNRITGTKLNQLAKSITTNNKFFDKLVGKAEPEKSEAPKTAADGKKTSKGKSKKAK